MDHAQLSADQGSVPDMAEPLRAVADDVRRIVIRNCGHVMPDEQPQAVAEAVLEFCEAP